MADTNFTPQEIEEFLQQFFDVVGARQYVGARYVPIFGRAGEDTVEWDDGAPYEPLTVVMHEGVSYVSRRYVPNGIQITDTDYWVETYRFNAQVEQYRQEVLGFQGQIDQVREDMESDYVPFPDSDTYPKYGLLGQVLTTLTGGETKWEDPVTVTADVAEPLIEEWLDSHPEATTTVQNGAITDPKINDSSSVVKVKTFPAGETLLRHVLAAGLYAINDVSGITDMPANAAAQKHTMLVLKENSVLSWQILTNINADLFWVRAASYDAADTWEQIYPSGKVANGVIGDSNISTTSTVVKVKAFPSGETLLRHVLEAGIYAINDVSSIEDLPSNATTTQKHTMLVLKENSLLSWQILTNINADTFWVRATGYDTSDTWEQIYPSGRVANGVIDDATVATASSIVVNRVFPTGETLLRHVLDAGIYTITPAKCATLTDMPGDAPLNDKYALLNIIENTTAPFYATWQVITNSGNTKVWMRAASTSSASRWRLIYSQARDDIAYDYRSALTGKHWYVLGDSATHGDFTGIDQPNLDSGPYAGQLPVYPFYIGNRNGMNVHNLAKNGATLAAVSTVATTHQISAEGFYDQVGTNADYITIWAGANDMWQHVPIGTIDDATNDTYYGAYNKVLTYFINNRPNAKLGLVASFWCTEPYVTATLNIGKKYGIPVLNLYDDPNVPVTVGSQNPDVAASVKSARDTQFRVSASNGHPSAKYHEMESVYIERWLETL